MGLPDNQSSLVIFDEFKGQIYVMVPPNCTDQLQPLDVSVNKPAKDFLWTKFRDWYAKKIFTPLGLLVTPLLILLTLG